MRSTQIENFFALAQCKSFSKAAEYCFITQPALSKNIHALEAELGVTLFRRTSWGVELTDAGKHMYDFFQKSSAEYSEALKEAKDISNSSQLIRIALMDGINDGVFWDFLYQVHGDLPLAELNFRFSEGGDRNIAGALVDEEIDCAVTFLSINTFSEIRDERICTVPIHTVRHHLYYSALHPATWEGRNPVPEDFRNSVFFFPNNTDRMHTPDGIVKTVDYFSDQLGFPLRYEFCEGIHSIYHNVIIDQGVAILLDCNYSDWSERIKNIPLNLSIDPSELVFAWRRDSKNEALLRLMQALPANRKTET